MLKHWQFTLLTGLALVAMVLVVTNIVLYTGNREAQTEFASRAQYIQQSQQLEPLYQGIVRNLAEISAKTNDPQISQLLKSQGISFTMSPPKDAESTPKSDVRGQTK